LAGAIGSPAANAGAMGSPAANAGAMGSSEVGCDWHSERRQRYSGRRDGQPGGECIP